MPGCGAGNFVTFYLTEVLRGDGSVNVFKAFTLRGCSVWI